MLRKMKNSKSSGIDQISSVLIKPVIDAVAPAIAKLINSSLTDGVFPEIFKIAKVICVYKGRGLRKEKSSYRPVSNLSLIGKCIEIAVEMQLSEYCEKYNVLGTHQHGFRKARSTSSALLTAVTRWRSQRQNNLVQGVLLMDLSAAYDVLNPDIFIKKAEALKFDQKTLKWLRCYLSGRSQVVEVGNAVSGRLYLNVGTPQGSPLSCLIFAIYVGDLPSWLKNYKYSFPLSYADDTFITVSADTETNLINRLEEVGDCVLGFFASNELIANADKTGLLIFRPHKINGGKLCITLGNEVIEESLEEKILGVKVQSDLKWDSQFKATKSELNHRIGVMSRLKNILRKRELKTIAEGLINSKIRYCVSVFCSEYLRTSDDDSLNKQMQDLQVLQNDAMRIIMNKKRSDHVRVEDLLKEVGFLSVNRTLAHVMLMENWKARNFDVPELKDILTECTSLTRTLRSESAHLVKSTLQEPYAIMSAKLWNLTTAQFRKTNLINIAKNEAKKLILKLPL